MTAGTGDGDGRTCGNCGIQKPCLPEINPNSPDVCDNWTPYRDNPNPCQNSENISDAMQICPKCGFEDDTLLKCTECGNEWRSYPVMESDEPISDLVQMAQIREERNMLWAVISDQKLLSEIAYKNGINPFLLESYREALVNAVINKGWK